MPRKKTIKSDKAATKPGSELSKNKIPDAKKPKTITIPALKIDVAILSLKGLTSLICHAWDPEVIRYLLNTYTDQPHTKKPKRDPKREYEVSLYRRPDGKWGFPGMAFRKAAIRACKHVDGLNMTDARGMFNVMEELIEIKGTPTPRQDICGIGKGGSPDVRTRAEFMEWEALVPVHFNSSVINLPQLANLFNIAGFSCGVGEWRPEKIGNHGMYCIKEMG